MKNYKLEISYDGTNYHGWQIQKNAVTVQAKIKSAIETILKEEVNLIGSGRTDSGVHALGQIANFKTEKEIDLSKFKYSLNSILPSDIAVKSIFEVDTEFHSRFDAKKRNYIYIFSKNKNPFLEKYSSRIKFNQEINVAKLNKIASALIGKHDFTSFAKVNSDVKNKICEIYEIRFWETKELIYFYVEANRFLHGMVRAILGTLLEVSKKDFPIKQLNFILQKKDRTVAGKAVSAKGLFLFKVKY